SADVTDDQRRAVWCHSTPFTPLREEPPDGLQAYNSNNLSVSHPNPKKSGISVERSVEAYIFAVRRPCHVAEGSHFVRDLAPLLRRQIEEHQFLVVGTERNYVTPIGRPTRAAYSL